MNDTKKFSNTKDTKKVKMMGKRALKKRIQSLTSRLEEHKLKIDLEQLKSMPDSKLIRHWEKEISAF